jgi:hypothetical protein
MTICRRALALHQTDILTLILVEISNSLAQKASLAT